MAFKKYATSAPVGKGFRPGVTDRAVCHEYMLHFENAGEIVLLDCRLVEEKVVRFNFMGVAKQGFTVLKDFIRRYNFKVDML